MRRIDCAEVWGGFCNHDGDLMTSGITASLFCGAAEGDRGGDIYYVSVCTTDLLTRIVLADVMGHGEAVATTSRWLHDALVAWMNRTEGDGLLEHLNRLAVAHGEGALTTAAVVAFYRHDSHLYYSYAGHPPLLVRRRATRRWERAVLPERGGFRNMPLGVQSQVAYDQQRTPLMAGDRLFLYTDGVLDAPDPRGDAFGLGNLMEVLQEAGDRSLPEVKCAVLAGLRRHTGGPLSHDDVTCMAIEIR